MTYVQKGLCYIPDKSIDELLVLYRNEKDGKASIRLLCAIHRKMGKSIPEIADMLFISTSTVSDHLRRLSDNFAGLYDKRNQSRPPKLITTEYQQLINAVKKQPTESGYPAIIWTTKMIRHYVENKFGKHFTLHGIRKLLYKANFVRLKPRPTHAKGNKKQQVEFKKNYPESLINICKLDMRSSFWMNQDSS